MHHNDYTIALKSKLGPAISSRVQQAHKVKCYQLNQTLTFHTATGSDYMYNLKQQDKIQQHNMKWQQQGVCEYWLEFQKKKKKHVDLSNIYR